MKMFDFQLTGHQKCYLLIFAFFIFQISNNFCQKSYEKAIFFIMDFEGCYKVVLSHKRF